MIDSAFFQIIAHVASAAVLLMFSLLVSVIIGIMRKKRVFKGSGKKGIIVCILTLLLLGGTAYLFYVLPDILFQGFVPWALLVEIGPASFINAIIAIFILVSLLIIYFALLFVFVKPNKRLVLKKGEIEG